MISSNDFRKGMVIEVNGALFIIIEFQHVNPGKGAAFVRSRLKDVKTGKVVDRTWRAGEKVRDVRLERKVMDFLYRTEDQFVLMDKESFEQIMMDKSMVGDTALYLVENSNVEVLFRGDTPIMVEPPIFVELSVKSTDPGLKGDTATGGSKPATLETGLVIQVPLFIREGEKLKIDTRTNSYIERAQK